MDFMLPLKIIRNKFALEHFMFSPVGPMPKNLELQIRNLECFEDRAINFYY